MSSGVETFLFLGTEWVRTIRRDSSTEVGMTSESYLPDPCPWRAFFPTLADLIERRFIERPLLKQFRILLPTLRILCADNRGMHSGNAQGEPQRDRHTF